MTRKELEKIYKMMLWVIPGMLMTFTGDYLMGVEPKDSEAISGMISSGWLTIADWRILLYIAVMAVYLIISSILTGKIKRIEPTEVLKNRE